MSRRRQNRHLERTQDVAEQVSQVLDSRGPCPGSCNAAWRRKQEKWEEEVTALFLKLRAKHRDVPASYALELAKQQTHQQWEDADRVSRWPAREGTPVWCLRCTAEIRKALDQLPRLLDATLELGVTIPSRPDGSLVTDPVRVLWTSDQDVEGRVVDLLACGHRRTRQATFGPTYQQPVLCRTCVVTASVPEPGRLAPPERLGRRGARQPVSPAGSPAWVEVDAAVQAVCSTADQARYLLDRARDERFPWRTGSTQDRVCATAAAAKFLLQRLDDVLALPGPLPESIGRQVLGVAARLTEVSGSSSRAFPVKSDCPACGRRGLVRQDGASEVHCRSCMAWFGEDELDRRLAEMGVEVPR